MLIAIQKEMDEEFAKSTKRSYDIFFKSVIFAFLEALIFSQGCEILQKNKSIN